MMKKVLAALTVTALCCSLSGCCVYSLLNKEVPAPTENVQEAATTSQTGATVTEAPTEQTEEAATTTTTGGNDAELDWGDDPVTTTRATTNTTSRPLKTETTRVTTSTTEAPQETDPTEIPDDDSFFNDVELDF